MFKPSHWYGDAFHAFVGDRKELKIIAYSGNDLVVIKPSDLQDWKMILEEYERFYVKEPRDAKF